MVVWDVCIFRERKHAFVGAGDAIEHLVRKSGVFQVIFADVEVY
jgi:hypothetical protein